MLNLALMLEGTAERLPGRDAVVLGDTRLSYAQLDGAANQVANLLAESGIRPGDRVALSCPNLPYFPVVYYGILKAGAVVVPLNVLLKAGEIAYHLQDSGAKAYFCFEGTPELPMGVEGWQGFGGANGCDHFFLITADLQAASPIEDARTLGAALAGKSPRFETVVTEATDTAVILYTSGTTGQPKGAELTHANMVMNALTCWRLFGAVEEDVHLVTLPLFHSFGQTVQMNAGLYGGATLVLLPRFDAATALALMERERVTFFAGVPTMYWGLLSVVGKHGSAPTIAAKLRMAISGGAPLPVEILEQVEKVYGVRIREGYGLSETSPVASFNHPGRKAKPGSIGQPIWGVQMKLVDTDWNEVPEGESGEIAIRGHNVMKGYHGRPDATAEVIRDGWFRTGDVARRDEDGYYFIVDRAKDMIVRGGFNVYPREIEEIILAHPDVSLVAVVGVPHESHGEEVKAFVIRDPGSRLTEGELVSWCKERMASYKYPRLVEFRDELPMTSTGKILKRRLRDQA
ncbi:long-chain fatty acid--CoA ligase [Micromonospora sp. PPF5-17]|uniref:Long-chain fatty acid--CoA ligase n=1 Tax=Micromonospora solifontis TaxID=2487138 RepID=A0ABX9WI85_9ACTN|nr:MULTISPECIES: long-chain fatty acid--CoA ligase [Micromonospora]NES37545.1 long-chain fatty acid--CoA ligase [Micromonospora solifontis]NES58233.1 long-chain fatty acid--CoA ligase [Micromonospora sp. PPF5-6]RNL98259.1 long-chain fatty acid--CoA ligase [Micromonospora solifontis]